jgi:hypothetical protein
VNSAGGKPEDRMESFFLAETLKYHYLLQVTAKREEKEMAHKMKSKRIHILTSTNSHIFLDAAGRARRGRR